MIAGPLIGSQAAAVCTVIVLSQGFRKKNESATSRAGQRLWAVACFALTVSLAAQIRGGPAGLTSREFRTTELGGAIALLALLVAAGVSAAHHIARRHDSSRPGIRTVASAAGAAVVLAAGLGMIVSRSSGTQPGQAFPWLCLLAAALATTASLAGRDRALVVSRVGYASDEFGGATVPARRVRPASHGAWDDAARPLSGNRAQVDREGEDDDWDAPAGRSLDADWDPPIREESSAEPAWPDSGAPAREDARAESAWPDSGAPAREDARAESAWPDSGAPAREDARAESAWPDSGAPAHEDAPAEPAWPDSGAPANQEQPVEAEPADGDSAAGKEPAASDDEDVSDWFRPKEPRADDELRPLEPQASDGEDVSDWFRPVARRAWADRDDTDSESAASWEAPADWFRPAKKPAADDSGNTPASPDGVAEATDEPDLFRSSN